MGLEVLVSAVAQDRSIPECPRGGEMAVLWALSVAQSAAGQGELTGPEVAAIVTRAGRHSMSRQAAHGHLTRLADEGLVHRRKRRKGPNGYSIMAAGEDILTDGTRVVIVDPARALQETRKLENVLGHLKGSVSICDPYLDSRSLDFLGSIHAATSVRFLTEKVTDEDKVRRELKAVQKQIGASVEVRKAPKGVLHDRYIIHDGGMLVLGTSLNSFGMKQSFVSKAGNDVREATRVFYDKKWGVATPL